MMKLASSAALLVAGVEANKFYKPNLSNDYAHGVELARTSDPSSLEGAYCAYTWHEKQGRTHAVANGSQACDMIHGGCNAPVYVLPQGETKDCCKNDQEKIYRALWADPKNPKEEEFTSLSQAVSWKTRNTKDKGNDRSPRITMADQKMFGTAMYNAVIQDVSALRNLVDTFSMRMFQVHTTEIKVGDRRFNALKASFTNNNGDTMKQVLDNMQNLVRTQCKVANQGNSGVIWRSITGPAVAAPGIVQMVPAGGVQPPADTDCDAIIAGIRDIDIHQLMGASDSTIIAPCSKDFAQLSKRENVPKGDAVNAGGVARFTNVHRRAQAGGAKQSTAGQVAEFPIATMFFTPTTAAPAACALIGPPGGRYARANCGFSNISAGLTHPDAATYGGFMRVGVAGAPAVSHDAPVANTEYFVSQTTYFVTKSGVQLQKSIQFAEAAQQAYNDLYWPECCCGISTCCCFATWMAIGGTLFVTISAAVAMMMCGFCDESEDSTYTETNAGASTEAKAEAPATESKPEVAEPEAESKGCNCCLIVIIAVVAVVVIVGLVYCCSGSNKSEMEEESDEEEQP